MSNSVGFDPLWKRRADMLWRPRGGWVGVALTWMWSLTWASAQVEQADLETLLRRFREHRDYRARHQLVHRGFAAVPGLMEMMRTGNEVQRREALIALRWVAFFLKEEKRVLERRQMAALLRQALRDEVPVVRTAAAELLGLVGAPDDAQRLADLLLHDPDERVREGARAGLVQLPFPSATEALLQAVRLAQGEWKARLIEGLGDHGDVSVLPFLAQTLQDASPEVRTATAQAMGRLGPEALVERDGDRRHVARQLLRELMGDPEEMVRRAAVEAALRIGRNERVRQQAPETARSVLLVALRQALTSHQREEALEGLRDVARREDVPAIVPFLQDASPSVQVSAVLALESIEDPDAVKALETALPHLAPPAQSTALQALSRLAPPVAQRTALTLLRAKGTPERVLIVALNLLGREGGEEATTAIGQALKHPSRVVRQAAADAVLRSGRVEECPLLLRTEGLTFATLAGALRLWSTKPGDVRKEVVLPFLRHSSPLVRIAAREALMARADALVERNRRREAIALLRDILTALGPVPEALPAAEKLRGWGVPVDLAQMQGFITHWWLIGPFPSPNKSAYDRAFFPEREVNLTKTYAFEGRKLRWRHVTTSDVQGRFDLLPYFQPNQHVAAYAYTEIRLPKGTEALLKVGSDDGIVVWLNGERVHGTNADRRLTVDQDVVRVHLRKGTNRLLLKILNGVGGWGYAVRVTTTEHRPISFEVKTE